MKIRIYISQSEIDNGKPKKPSFCPIALSANKILNCISVGTRFMYINTWHMNETRLLLPPEAVQFIRSFDRGLPVQPFDFVVEL